MLGSTRLVTNGTAAPRRFDYFPFGGELTSGDTSYRGMGAGFVVAGDPAQRFTGKERDTETGLDYFGARYLASAQGRFASPDGLTYSSKHLEFPQRWNLYSYTRNLPLSFIDPDGYDDKKPVPLGILQVKFSAGLGARVSAKVRGAAEGEFGSVYRRSVTISSNGNFNTSESVEISAGAAVRGVGLKGTIAGYEKIRSENGVPTPERPSNNKGGAIEVSAGGGVSTKDLAGAGQASGGGKLEQGSSNVTVFSAEGYLGFGFGIEVTIDVKAAANSFKAAVNNAVSGIAAKIDLQASQSSKSEPIGCLILGTCRPL